MDKNLLEIRKVKPEDAKEWVVFGFKIWRDAYKNIFPEEDLIGYSGHILSVIEK